MLKKYNIPEFLQAEFQPYPEEYATTPHKEAMLHRHKPERGIGAYTFILEEQYAKLTQEIVAKNKKATAFGPEHTIFYTVPSGTLSYEKFDYIYNSAKTSIVQIDVDVFTPEALEKFHKEWDSHLDWSHAN
jgi:hypothetical protein